MRKKYIGMIMKKEKERGIQKIGKKEEIKLLKINAKYVVAQKH